MHRERRPPQRSANWACCRPTTRIRLSPAVRSVQTGTAWCSVKAVRCCSSKQWSTSRRAMLESWLVSWVSASQQTATTPSSWLDSPGRYRPRQRARHGNCRRRPGRGPRHSPCVRQPRARGLCAQGRAGPLIGAAGAVEAPLTGSGAARRRRTCDPEPEKLRSGDRFGRRDRPATPRSLPVCDQ